MEKEEEGAEVRWKMQEEEEEEEDHIATTTIATTTIASCGRWWCIISHLDNRYLQERCSGWAPDGGNHPHRIMPRHPVSDDHEAMVIAILPVASTASNFVQLLKERTEFRDRI